MLTCLTNIKPAQYYAHCILLRPIWKVYYCATIDRCTCSKRLDGIIKIWSASVTRAGIRDLDSSDRQTTYTYCPVCSTPARITNAGYAGQRPFVHCTARLSWWWFKAWALADRKYLPRVKWVFQNWHFWSAGGHTMLSDNGSSPFKNKSAPHVTFHKK